MCPAAGDSPAVPGHGGGSSWHQQLQQRCHSSPKSRGGGCCASPGLSQNHPFYPATATLTLLFIQLAQFSTKHRLVYHLN